eukprot:jgi/Tetstr1/455238/TSEL_042085.t1
MRWSSAGTVSWHLRAETALSPAAAGAFHFSSTSSSSRLGRPSSHQPQARHTLTFSPVSVVHHPIARRRKV